MKMTLIMLTILLAMFGAVPVFASCPVRNGELTGAACSVNGIKNLEKSKMQMQEKVDFNPKTERNLRPVKSNLEIRNPDEESCIFCMQEAIFGK